MNWTIQGYICTYDYVEEYLPEANDFLAGSMPSGLISYNSMFHFTMLRCSSTKVLCMHVCFLYDELY